MDSQEQYELEQAARELAKRLIRPYVTRGDPFEHLKASHLGMGCTEEYASIGGLMDGKKYNSDFISVPHVNGQTANVSFKLRDIFREIEGEAMSAAALEDFKLEPG